MVIAMEKLLKQFLTEGLDDGVEQIRHLKLANPKWKFVTKFFVFELKFKNGH